MAVASVTQQLTAIPDPKLVSASGYVESAAWLRAAPIAPAGKRNPHGWYQHALTVAASKRGVNILSLAASSLSPRERVETHGLARHTLEPLDPHLRAPFALAICPRQDTGFYEMLGWGVAEWPSGTIDLDGSPW